MSKLADLKLELLSLKRELARIQKEGRVLMDCWVAKARPAPGKPKYYRLKSRRPIFDGKKTEYIGTDETALEAIQIAIDRGKAVKKLNKQIKALTTKIKRQQKKRPKSIDKLEPELSAYYAPPELMARVVDLLEQIDLNPISDAIGQQWVQAAHYYTLAEDGLSQPWFGRVWLQPPLRHKTRKWINKAVSEFEAGNVTELVLLVRTSITSKWFQALLDRFPVCFLSQQFQLWDDQGQPQPEKNQRYAVFYLGSQFQKFQKVFCSTGSISVPSGLLKHFEEL